MGALKMGERVRAGATTMDKKRLEYYKKKLQTRREELAEEHCAHRRRRPFGRRRSDRGPRR